MKNLMEKTGSFGAILAAAACPVCFPKLALIGALLGMGALAKYEAIFFYMAQALVLIALTGNVISYKKHRNRVLLALVICSVGLFFISLYVLVSETLSYISLAGIILATVWLIVLNKRCDNCKPVKKIIE